MSGAVFTAGPIFRHPKSTVHGEEIKNFLHTATTVTTADVEETLAYQFDRARYNERIYSRMYDKRHALAVSLGGGDMRGM